MFWQDNHIKFDNIPKNEYLAFDWKSDKWQAIDLSRCRYLVIWHHTNKERTFGNLPNIPNLEYLEINWSNSISLTGLSKFKRLRRLELHYCIKLESLDGIEALSRGIEHVHINQSKKLKGHDRIMKLNNLNTLCFNDCGEVDNIYFIKKIAGIKDFRFVNTNVLNGDLKPLFEHPKIENVGFLNKRHYSHKDTDVDKIIATR